MCGIPGFIENEEGKKLVGQTGFDEGGISELGFVIESAVRLHQQGFWLKIRGISYLFLSFEISVPERGRAAATDRYEASVDSRRTP